MDYPLIGGYVATFLVAIGYFAYNDSARQVPATVPQKQAAAASAATAMSVRTVAAAPAGVAKDGAKEPAKDVAKAPTGAAQPAEAGGWTVPDVDGLPDNAFGRMVRRGRELTQRTFAHLGPEVEDPAMRFAGNNLACQSCHLDAGTKEFGLPFVGVFGDFPQYRGREGRVATIEDRVNGCMTRSMDGKPLPWDSEPMVAFVTYIKFLSSNRPVGKPTPGRGTPKMAELSRPASPEKGAIVFQEHCASCHGPEGRGKRVGVAGDGKGYEFPPLGGTDTFNNGAGMARLITAASFVRANMPFGTSHDAPVLTEEEAWDVTAYVESLDRPQREGIETDYPNRTEKPVDAAYGPFPDTLPAAQHKYGPFQPIRDEIKKLKNKATDAAKTGH
ncbi:c-type cytochrome [Xanthobacter agilis]|uniref:c-type cytochrome n=1 Tax=Xanthobacter agilis TaxID=47492 RepID=UPI003728D3D3